MIVAEKTKFSRFIFKVLMEKTADLIRVNPSVTCTGSSNLMVHVLIQHR